MLDLSDSCLSDGLKSFVNTKGLLTQSHTFQGSLAGISTWRPSSASRVYRVKYYRTFYRGLWDRFSLGISGRQTPGARCSEC